MEISLKQALLGFEKNLTHLDGRQVTVNREGVTQPGYIIKINGEGMPIHEKSGEFGDLFVKIKVLIPSTLTENQKLLAENLFNRRSSW